MNKLTIFSKLITVPVLYQCLFQGPPGSAGLQGVIGAPGPAVSLSPFVLTFFFFFLCEI